MSIEQQRVLAEERKKQHESWIAAEGWVSAARLVVVREVEQGRVCCSVLEEDEVAAQVIPRAIPALRSQARCRWC
jgi:hypothetical protein